MCEISLKTKIPPHRKHSIKRVKPSKYHIFLKFVGTQTNMEPVAKSSCKKDLNNTWKEKNQKKDPTIYGRTEKY
uniref:Uncharacterized protein n=1 Tax=Rhizophora mucronata TaxID=61149 RepID=A0A2P2Q601_RHIMU